MQRLLIIILLFLFSCSDNLAPTSANIEQFPISLYVELRNAATGELQEGYVLAGDDSLHTASGLIDDVLNDSSVTSIHTGLIKDGRAGSYLRKTSIYPGTNNISELYHVDFLFRDIHTGSVIGELSRDGYDFNGPMDVTRFLKHIEDNILVYDMVPRWKDYVPEKIVFADSYFSEFTHDGNHYEISSNFQDHEVANMFFEKYKQQWEEIIQPHLLEDVPFERVDQWIGGSDRDNIVVMIPSGGFMEINRDSNSSLITSSLLGVIRDKETHPNHLFGSGLHQLYRSLINEGLFNENTRTDESVLPKYSTLRNEISSIDSKVLYELSQNPRIDFDELATEYLILPTGF